MKIIRILSLVALPIFITSCDFQLLTQEDLAKKAKALAEGLGLSNSTVTETDNSTTSNSTVTPTPTPTPTPAPTPTQMKTLTVIDGSGSGFYLPGDRVTVRARTPLSGQAFAGWVTDAPTAFSSTSTAEAIVTMPATNVTAAASFRSVYPLTVNKGSGSGNYFSGETVQISAEEPSSGFGFVRWTGNVTFDNALSANTSLTMPERAETVEAVFGAVYSLNVVSGNGSGNFPAGKSLSISADPPPNNMMFAAWQASGLVIFGDTFSANTTMTMPAMDVSVTATYSYIPPNLPLPNNPVAPDVVEQGALWPFQEQISSPMFNQTENIKVLGRGFFDFDILSPSRKVLVIPIQRGNGEQWDLMVDSGGDFGRPYTLEAAFTQLPVADFVVSPIVNTTDYEFGKVGTTITFFGSTPETWTILQATRK